MTVHKVRSTERPEMSATERVAAMRARAERHASDIAAAGRLTVAAHLSGADATQLSALAAIADGITDAAAIADAVATGTRSARSMAGTEDRAAMRDRLRMASVVDASNYVQRESRTDAIARNVGFRYGRTAATAVRAALTDTDTNPMTAVRSALMDAIGHAPGGITERESRQAADVVAALLADGKVARPDHDAATCQRSTCRTCGRVAPALSIMVTDTGKVRPDGRRVSKVNRADRAPAERFTPAPADLGKGRKSTDGQVQIIRETSLLSMTDLARNWHATRVDAFATTEDRSNLAVLITDAITEPTSGVRGYGTRPEMVRPVRSVSNATAAAMLRTAVHEVVRGQREHVALTVAESRTVSVLRRSEDMAPVLLLTAAAATVAERFGLSDYVHLAHRARRSGLPITAAALSAACGLISPEPVDVYGEHRSQYRADKARATAVQYGNGVRSWHAVAPVLSAPVRNGRSMALTDAYGRSTQAAAVMVRTCSADGIAAACWLRANDPETATVGR